MRKEMDELRNAIKGKTYQSLDRMVRKTDSPFNLAVQECPMPSKFRLPQLEPFDWLKDPLDHLKTFKTTLGLQQPPNFLPPSRGQPRNDSSNYQCPLLTTLCSWAEPSFVTLLAGSAPKGRKTICSPSSKERRKHWGFMWHASPEELWRWTKQTTKYN